jgi:histone acetyltransferase (RNA polymerase elongator complex component)
LLESEKQLRIKDNCEWDGIKTTIIGEKPDLESYRNFVCLDTRSREIRNKYEKWNKQDETVPNLVIRQYQSSVWREFFISFEDLQGYIYWFTRLLLPDSEQTIQRDWLWKDTALIRELHIYWQLAWLKENVDSNDQKQHHWFGSQLLSMAEQISKNNWYKNLSVISWVWVRKYYEKQWYSLVGTYMVKDL